jgi:hypothetical protein
MLVASNDLIHIQLALASQSLSIVFELIPYVRETFRRHLSQKQAVMLVEFDKLKRVCCIKYFNDVACISSVYRTTKSIRTKYMLN